MIYLVIVKTAVICIAAAAFGAMIVLGSFTLTDGIREKNNRKTFEGIVMITAGMLMFFMLGTYMM